MAARQTKAAKKLMEKGLEAFTTVEAVEVELKKKGAWSGEKGRSHLLHHGAKLHKDAVLGFFKAKGKSEQDAEKLAKTSVIAWRFLQEGHDGMVKLQTGTVAATTQEMPGSHGERGAMGTKKIAFLLATYLLHCQDLYTAANCAFSFPNPHTKLNQKDAKQGASRRRGGHLNGWLTPSFKSACLPLPQLLTQPPPHSLWLESCLGPGFLPRLATVPHQSRKQAAHPYRHREGGEVRGHDAAPVD
jgi:hypothetical protein